MNTSPTAQRLLAIPVLALALVCGVQGANAERPLPASVEWKHDFTAGKKAIAARNWKAASDSFEKVVEKDPRNADAYELLGDSLRWQRRFDEAVSAYEKVLALDPNYKGSCESC